MKLLYAVHSMMYEVKDLTQLQQVWGNRGPQPGEHGTGRQ